MFTIKRKSHLLVVDYYSRFLEIANLSDTKAANVTVYLKSMFVRYELPEILVTENSSQFACQTLALKYGFQHVTRILRFKVTGKLNEKFKQLKIT